MQVDIVVSADEADVDWGAADCAELVTCAVELGACVLEFGTDALNVSDAEFADDVAFSATPAAASRALQEEPIAVSRVQIAWFPFTSAQ